MERITKKRKVNEPLKALRNAVRGGNLDDVVKCLPDVRQNGNENWYIPLRLACKEGKTDIIEYFVKHGDYGNRNDLKNLLFRYVCGISPLNVVQLFLDNFVFSEPTIAAGLRGACAENNLDVVKFLYTEKRATVYDSEGLSSAVRNGHIEVIKFLLEKNADHRLEAIYTPAICYYKEHVYKLLCDNVAEKDLERTLYKVITPWSKIIHVTPILNRLLQTNVFGETELPSAISSKALLEAADSRNLELILFFRKHCTDFQQQTLCDNAFNSNAFDRASYLYGNVVLTESHWVKYQRLPPRMRHCVDLDKIFYAIGFKDEHSVVQDTWTYKDIAFLPYQTRNQIRFLLCWLNRVKRTTPRYAFFYNDLRLKFVNALVAVSIKK